MWLAIESVKNKDADIVLSAGNTGALVIIAKLNLEMIQNISKPALSGLWPNKIGMSVVLDLGANVECDEKNLIDFCLMGSALHKSLYPEESSRVALLNIGSEEMKGSNVIKNTYQKLSDSSNSLYEFCGFIEGNHIMDGNINVVVTDGFTGNVALKTAEGTQGVCVIYIDSKKTLLATMQLINKIDEQITMVIQEFIKTPYDVRAMILNGEVVAQLKRDVITDDFRSNISQGQTPKKIKLT